MGDTNSLKRNSQSKSKQDEQGNEYEATYPKRAKGLVKNGRARFVGENKICLACPPDNIREDILEIYEIMYSDAQKRLSLI